MSSIPFDREPGSNVVFDLQCLATKKQPDAGSRDCLLHDLDRTTVFMRRTKPVASFRNLTPAKFDELEDRIADDFRRVKR